MCTHHTRMSSRSAPLTVCQLIQWFSICVSGSSDNIESCEQCRDREIEACSRRTRVGRVRTVSDGAVRSGGGVVGTGRGCCCSGGEMVEACRLACSSRTSGRSRTVSDSVSRTSVSVAGTKQGCHCSREGLGGHGRLEKSNVGALGAGQGCRGSTGSQVRLDGQCGVLGGGRSHSVSPGVRNLSPGRGWMVDDPLKQSTTCCRPDVIEDRALESTSCRFCDKYKQLLPASDLAVKNNTTTEVCLLCIHPHAKSKMQPSNSDMHFSDNESKLPDLSTIPTSPCSKPRYRDTKGPDLGCCESAVEPICSCESCRECECLLQAASATRKLPPKIHNCLLARRHEFYPRQRPVKHQSHRSRLSCRERSGFKQLKSETSESPAVQSTEGVEQSIGGVLDETSSCTSSTDTANRSTTTSVAEQYCYKASLSYCSLDQPPPPYSLLDLSEHSPDCQSSQLHLLGQRRHLSQGYYDKHVGQGEDHLGRSELTRSWISPVPNRTVCHVWDVPDVSAYMKSIKPLSSGGASKIEERERSPSPILCCFTRRKGWGREKKNKNKKCEDLIAKREKSTFRKCDEDYALDR